MEVNWKNQILFWGVCILLFFVYAFQEILFFPAHSIHYWRQADCISLAMNFQETNNPFHPSIHNYISDSGTSGKSAGEFTGLYYLVGKLWSWFGVHLWMYRLINLSILFLACFSLYKVLLKQWKDVFWSLFVSLFIFTSPLIVFYAPNFLTDITALGFTIWGWAKFIQYQQDKRIKYLVFAFVFFTLAALFKVTAGISVLSLLGVFGLELLGVFKKEKTLFPEKVRTILIGFISFLFVFSWYYYASYYNEIHGGKYTFNNLWSYWSLSDESYRKALKFFYEITIWQFFHKSVLFMLSIFTIASLVLTFIHSKKAFVFLLINFFGSTLYILFWFGALENHDYYFINLFILPFFVLIPIISYRDKFTIKVRYGLKIMALFMFVLGVFYSASNIRLRYSERLTVGEYLSKSFFPNDQIIYWNWISSTYVDGGLLTIEKYNRKIGIKPDDLVVCYPDPSFNISLTRLNQKGWTSFNNQEHDSIPLQSQIELGAKYLIINKYILTEHDKINSFMTDSIGFHKGYTIYKLENKY